jgi:MFS family permease
MSKSHHASVETRQSWTVATVALVCMLFAFGGPWIIVVALKDVAAEAGGARSVPALASSLAWLCSGLGGILMGRIAERFGTRWTVMTGALSIAIGLSGSTLGLPWPLWISHALFVGLFGLGGINSPLYVYVSHWFDKRRGSALALISSGNYLAGALWPPLFEPIISHIGWRQTMLGWAAIELVIIVPLAAYFFSAPPKTVHIETAAAARGKPRVLGMPPNLAFGLLCGASVLCCVPMSMPQGHLVAFCSDLGFSRTFGAAMLSVLLGTAFISRQFWGAMADKIGGLTTVMIGSAWQAMAMSAFLVTQSEVGLITVSAAFGLGFSGIIPAYVVAIRELFPAKEAYWRIPTCLMFTAFGMASGGWLAGLLYDHFGYYLPAFGAGVLANLANLSIISFLVFRSRGEKRRHTPAPDPDVIPAAPA